MIQEIKNNSAANYYSEFNHQLLNQILRKDDFVHYRLDLERDDVIGFMRDYGEAAHNLSPWPIFINEDRVRSFELFIQLYPKIVYKAISSFFSNNCKAFEEYLNEPGIVLDLLNDAIPDDKDLCVRHDIIFSNNQFKLIEANCGSSIGGWQHDWLNHLYIEALEKIEFKPINNIRYKNIVTAMLMCAGKSVISLKGSSAKGNLLLFDAHNKSTQHLQDIYDQVRPDALTNGTIHFFNDFADLKFDADENVIYDGKVMDAVLLTLEADIPVPKSAFLRLVSSHLKKKIVFPDSPLQTVIGNKLIMALLHEEEVLESLTSEEKSFVSQHVPWSCKLNREVVYWQGNKQSLQQLLLSHKDEFVIKKSQSLQGRDVFVGKFTSYEKWDSVVRERSQDNDWLVQQYCKPDEVTLCNPAIGVASHELVWGIFGLGNHYHGSFVRAMPTESFDAVINSANGATEYTVFEQFKPKKKIII